MKEVITRRTGPDTAPRFSLNAAGESTQIAIRDTETGNVEVIFTGESFSEEEYELQGGADKERRYFTHYQVLNA